MRKGPYISKRPIRLATIVFVGIFTFLAIHNTVSAKAPEFGIDGDQIYVDDSPDTDVIAFGKKVIINKRAKSVFVVGGDVEINGDVEGSVGVIGGSVTQKKEAFIGGDVMVIGGSYKPEIDHPLRNAGKETVMLGIFEDEIRDFSRNPSNIFSPELSAAYIAQRLLSILFWFLISMGLVTIAPGGISRAVTRLKLSSLKVAVIGVLAMISVIIGVAAIGVAASAGFLPNYLGGIVGLMALILLVLAYVMGRVTLHVIVGKYIQKHFFGEGLRSEAFAILFGVIAWAVILSIPYLWTVGVLSLFIAGVGLVLTAKATTNWSAG